jgi:two-component system chemotaxis response regulator CheY
MSERNKTVVIADDEAHVRLYMKALLKTLNFDVVGEAKDGVEATTLALEKRPDLVLLDLNMPMRTGEEALEDILGKWPQARVVMLSSVADRLSVEHCLTLGALHFIRKDCSPAEIRTILTDLIQEGAPT